MTPVLLPPRVEYPTHTPCHPEHSEGSRATAVSNRSAHVGLAASTSASFLERRQPFLGMDERVDPVASRKSAALASAVLRDPVLEVVGNADIHDLPVHACQDVDVERTHLPHP